MSGSQTSLIASLVHTISAHTSDVNCVAFSTDNKLATSSGDKTTRLWDINDFTELPSSPLCGHTYYVHCCTFSPFGTTVATCSTDGKLIIWDVQNGKKVAMLQHQKQNGIRVCRFSPNSKYLISGSDDETACLWNVQQQKLLRTFAEHEASIVGCAFSPDSNFVVTGCSNGNLRAWDANYGHSKHLAYILEGHDLGVTCCDFSPTYGSAREVYKDGSVWFLLATCGQDSLVKLWVFHTQMGSRTVDLTTIHTMVGHSGPVMCCCFSPNGQLLASASIDKTIRLWDPATGSSLHIISGHSRYVTSCAFSSDSQLLASGSNDKTVLVWKITTQGEAIDNLNTDQDRKGAAEQSYMTVKPIAQWAVEDVCNWLVTIGMGHYTDNFKSNDIDGTELVSLNSEMLISLRIDALGHRNKILRAMKCISVKNEHLLKDPDAGIPDEYLCPITRELMKDPVIAEDGYTYERAAITAWTSKGKDRSPMTNAILSTKQLTPNRSLKMLIQRHLNG
ncbi:WD repeat, SAM and U-box domain-containing protein 1-like [Pecten maximus]|uniref:WD repeat, SAM and U-box domain-containing protein 1-like n=1 Tax=Pecten maximus TaxID=6579 RepID=UPI0014589B7E|nr:WD repeat, SAM and U-box domain-containing protein 1-like [Pecten maximus]XP_033733129.1 WD repeat, SAM and U-box domain-containing protein 1-like [Pecten maximus]